MNQDATLTTPLNPAQAAARASAASFAALEAGLDYLGSSDIELVRRAYREAVNARYRFYSYGDAMLIV